MHSFHAYPISLTTRVMAFVALAISLSLLLISYLVQNAIEHHFAEQDAEELQVITHAVERVLLAAEPEPKYLPESLSHAVSGHHGVYFQVQDGDGILLYRTPDANFGEAMTTLQPVWKITPASLQVWQSAGKSYRGVVTLAAIGQGQYRITTAIDMDFHRHFLEDFKKSLWPIMSLAGLLTLLSAWFGVHQGHAPLRRVADSLADIKTSQLHTRLDADSVPQEMRELVLSFNRMIERLEDGFTRLSHFSADIAHELRTPLTNLITQTQVGLSRARSQDEYRELLYSNLEEQERLAKMVGDMLWLAKSDHGQIKLITLKLDLAEEINALFDFFGALADEKQISLNLAGLNIQVVADRALLRRALSNLLSNAIRHTQAKKQVRVNISKGSAGEVLIAVENSGDTIMPEHLPRLFERFYRVDPSRQRHSDGAGLGLAIVKSIITMHGGHIDVYSNNGITRFTISLPAISMEQLMPQ